ncbi:bifunctional (p)ppGpp synthetase/guanosine-3',5'-bis(diphosphate) 3'-pyrophosphohydrolase [Candidatus Nomurabacteria bacterium]|nr:bifunctional (p)ppGpp synthetase/guanosine-3',5'-bis(diphosphate) 3'-pyrophosphohydrolase [Candidatus Nomurabacteria bacterium]
MYTYKIEQATKAAALLHQDQLRKGEVALPYITHLVGVTMILRDYTDDEDTLVAALLHDTIEDTDYTLEELKADFGEKAALYVDTVSEHWYEGENKLPWLEVKKNYAKQLRKGPIEAVMIAAADKIHNFRSAVDEYFDNHQRFIKDFGPHLESRIEAYQCIANAINSRLPDGIVHEFNHTFQAYKNFIFDVQENYNKNS